MDEKKEIQTTSPSSTPSDGQTAADAVGGAISGIGQQLRRGLDRMSFEADKRLRAGRVRAESIRLQKQAADLMEQIAECVLELDAAGAEIEPSLKAMVDDVRGLRRQAADMAAEIEAIHAEQWVEPATPVLPAPSQAPVREPSKGSRPRSQAVRPASTPSTATEAGTQANCPACGGPLRPMSVFCPNCGHKL
ncbi:MAG TPA: zinc ribbon domain-containing protein [Chloroflexia bacterium]|nr:zinc ribbon domain-containing protein [Chloroflexia bacterium]